MPLAPSHELASSEPHFLRLVALDAASLGALSAAMLVQSVAEATRRGGGARAALHAASRHVTGMHVTLFSTQLLQGVPARAVAGAEGARCVCLCLLSLALVVRAHGKAHQPSWLFADAAGLSFRWAVVWCGCVAASAGLQPPPAGLDPFPHRSPLLWPLRGDRLAGVVDAFCARCASLRLRGLSSLLDPRPLGALPLAFAAALAVEPRAARTPAAACRAFNTVLCVCGLLGSRLGGTGGAAALAAMRRRIGGGGGSGSGGSSGGLAGSDVVHANGAAHNGGSSSIGRVAAAVVLAHSNSGGGGASLGAVSAAAALLSSSQGGHAFAGLGLDAGVDAPGGGGGGGGAGEAPSSRCGLEEELFTCSSEEALLRTALAQLHRRFPRAAAFAVATFADGGGVLERLDCAAEAEAGRASLEAALAAALPHHPPAASPGPAVSQLSREAAASVGLVGRAAGGAVGAPRAAPPDAALGMRRSFSAPALPDAGSSVAFVCASGAATRTSLIADSAECARAPTTRAPAHTLLLTRRCASSNTAGPRACTPSPSAFSVPRPSRRA